MCRQIENEGLSVRQAELIARKRGGESKAAPSDVSRETPDRPIDPAIADIEARLEVLGTKVTIVKGKGHGPH